MPTSNRIILTDVDGVLLEWENHFSEWMINRSYFDENGKRFYPYKLLDDKQNTYEIYYQVLKKNTQPLQKIKMLKKKLNKTLLLLQLANHK